MKIVKEIPTTREVWFIACWVESYGIQAENWYIKSDGKLIKESDVQYRYSVPEVLEEYEGIDLHFVVKD